jgi:OOP family OmpA-OmpF porin
MMKKIILLCFINLPFVTNCFSQFSTDEISTENRLNSERINSWSVGGGLSNFIMHGELAMTIPTGTLEFLEM